MSINTGSKERPILFSAPMVRALLDGSKTQTRRPVKRTALEWLAPDMFTPDYVADPANGLCPYGAPGDRLYVRETWSQPTNMDPGPTVYRADYPACVPAGFTNLPAVDEITWKPSIHMPRALSRIMLEIVAVRVERLNACSEVDARAEGASLFEAANHLSHGGWSHDGHYVHETAQASYAKLWESINGAGSWAVNPWVWVVEFKQVVP